MTPILALLSILFGGDKAHDQEQAAAAFEASREVRVAYVQPADEAVDLDEPGQPEDITEPEPPANLPQPEFWKGEASFQGQTIAFEVEVQPILEEPRAWLSVPVQGIQRMELSNVTRTTEDGRTTLTFTLEIPGAPEAQWPTWTMTLDESGDRAEGNVLQAGVTMPAVMERTEEVLGPKRPQHPKRPLPYPEMEVEIDAGEHTLAGTLTLPDEGVFGEGPYPAAIFLTGSGPQDRDETLGGHKPFYVLSDHLTTRGIATLRYDDRGTAKSTGDYASATMVDFMDDARAAIEFLEGRDEIGDIGLIGHSEGGMIAPEIAATNRGLDYIVLLAAPAVPGREIMLLQSREMAKAADADEAQLDEQEADQRAVFDAVANGDNESELREKVRTLVAKQVQGAPEAVVEQYVDQSVGMLTGPWMKHFMTYDPRPFLRDLSIPVLALNGSKDLQVLTDQNLREIKEIAEESGKGNIEAHELEGLNHMFQPAETGLGDEYSQIETTFDEGAMMLISDWITRVTVGEEAQGAEN